jgi:hypothetical protein
VRLFGQLDFEEEFLDSEDESEVAVETQVYEIEQDKRERNRPIFF